jgi:hypothetical protein
MPKDMTPDEANLIEELLWPMNVDIYASLNQKNNFVIGERLEKLEEAAIYERLRRMKYLQPEEIPFPTELKQ